MPIEAANIFFIIHPPQQTLLCLSMAFLPFRPKSSTSSSNLPKIGRLTSRLLYLS